MAPPTPPGPWVSLHRRGTEETLTGERGKVSPVRKGSGDFSLVKWKPPHILPNIPAIWCLPRRQTFTAPAGPLGFMR